VPTEIVASPDGQPLANPPIPDKVDAYLAQLQNMAQHFRQSTAGAAQAAPPANVNSAYAGLPATPSSAGPQVIRNPAMQQQPAQPQTQGNPYVNAAANPSVYGQAQNVYAAPPQQAAPPQAAPQVQQQGSYQQQVAAQSPAMPGNAMPRSYRDPMADASVAAAAAAPGVMAAGAVAGAETARLAATSKPARPELPAGAPPLAFDGFCPVTLKTVNRWEQGNLQFGAVHRGRTYLFAGAEQRDQFMANPDGFSPVFAGLDPVLLIDLQQSVEGSRALGFRYGESFYLFSSEETKQKFAASPHTYAAGVRQAMNRIDSAGTVRR
jgi:YHS domain-containing protein